jgi:hypothetical protein
MIDRSRARRKVSAAAGLPAALADGRACAPPNGREARLRSLQLQTKGPAWAGPRFAAARPAYFFAGAERVAAIMKSSKRFSATLNQRISSSRNFFHGSYTFLKAAFLADVSSNTSLAAA